MLRCTALSLNSHRCQCRSQLQGEEKETLSDSAQDHKSALVDALLGVPVMQEADGRALVLTELADRGYLLDAMRYSRDRHDVWAIVTACSRQQGALAELVAVLRGIEGNHLVVNRVSRIVDQLESGRPPMIRAERRDSGNWDLDSSSLFMPTRHVAKEEFRSTSADVDRELLRCGVQLGMGARGRVYDLLNSPGYVYKEYISSKINGGALADLVLKWNTFSDSEKQTLSSTTAWPIARVVDRGRIAGCIMRKIPDEFYITLARGARPAYLTYLCYPPRHAWIEVPMPSAADRIAIASQMLDLFALLQQHSLVIGDVSAQNLLWSCHPMARILLLGCDAIRSSGALSSLPEGETPNWHDPLLGGRAPNFDSDNYKAALSVGRILSLDPHLRPGEPFSFVDGVPQAVVREVTELFAAAAGPAGERPEVREWQEALSARDALRIPPPELPERGYRIWPLYFALDVSALQPGSGFSERGEVERLRDSYEELLMQIIDDLACDPVISDIARVCIVHYAGEANVLIPLSYLGCSIPSLNLQPGPRRYGPAFRLMNDLIRSDIPQLEAAGCSVMRPMIFFFSSGKPSDNWRDSYDELTGPTAPLPHICTWDIGDPRETNLVEIASAPHNHFTGTSISPGVLLGEFFRRLVSSNVEEDDASGTATVIVIPEEGSWTSLEDDWILSLWVMKILTFRW